MMDQALDKSDFSIVMTNGGVDDSSEFWQDQCKLLYDSIKGNLSEGSIEASKEKGVEGDRVVLITLFSTLIASEITRKVFVDIIIPEIKAWLEFRRSAKVEIIYPDGTKVKISK